MTAPFSHYPSHPAPVSVPLVVLPEHDCSYLPGRKAMSRALMVGQMPGVVYHHFMNAGFRRSGKLLYQPICNGCRACIPLRVPVNTFSPSKSQRRCARKNSDLSVAISYPAATEEKFTLYRQYMKHWHGKAECEEDWETFKSFLYDSPVETIEFSYRDPAGRLLAVGICDVCHESLSSVYYYYDPDMSHRGLGTFGAIVEIETARTRTIPYYYLGYWVSACPAMRYKADYRPCEILDTDGIWRPLDKSVV